MSSDEVARELAAVLDTSNVKSELNVSSRLGEGGACEIHISLNLHSIGSPDRAKKYRRYFTTFGRMWSLAGRLEPVCDHELADFRRYRTALASLFVEMWPKRQVTPKLHKMLYHVLDQLVELRSVGMLHEGVVEAVHVVDNRMILRF